MEVPEKMRKNQNAEIRKPEILEHYYQAIVQEGLEGASIGKIAKRMNIHPSLIIHYFQNKNNMTIELVDLVIEKYEAPQLLRFGHIADPAKRYQAFIDTIFSKEWSKTVDPSVFFGFYYLSFRNRTIRTRFEAMFRRFRDYLVREFETYQSLGLVKAENLVAAADVIVTMIEGLEFHAGFLAASDQPFERFAHYARGLALKILSGEVEPGASSLNVSPLAAGNY